MGLWRTSTTGESAYTWETERWEDYASLMMSPRFLCQPILAKTAFSLMPFILAYCYGAGASAPTHRHCSRTILFYSFPVHSMFLERNLWPRNRFNPLKRSEQAQILLPWSTFFTLFLLCLTLQWKRAKQASIALRSLSCLDINIPRMRRWISWVGTCKMGKGSIREKHWNMGNADWGCDVGDSR